MSILQTLTAVLDSPSIPWKTIILGFTIAQYGFENYLSYRQHRALLNATEPPALLKEHMTQETFDKSKSYALAKSRFSFITSAVGVIQNIAIIKLDFLPKLWTAAGSAYNAVSPFLPLFAQSSVIAHSVVFLLGLQCFSLVFSTPIAYYQNFVLEESFGFNKLTVGLWVSDTVKSFLLSVFIGFPLTAVFLKIIDHFGDSFIFYVWCFMVAVQIIAIAIYPTLIQPLFNKLEPLQEGELKESIENLARENKFPLTKLHVIDGSKRSSHSNAYFYGLPWSKQIVIYDTLIETSTTLETTAVLAHEIGHWYLSHTTKALLLNQCHLYAIFSLFSIFTHNDSLFRSFGFMGQQPVIVGFLLFNDIFQPLDTVMTFFMHLLSRKNEYEADEYAVGLGYADSLKKSLINLNMENLSSPTSDWLFSAFHYSHPTLPERLVAIEKKAKELDVKQK
ncbi:hypothetical protein WICPIJ_003424 [Wickerhamomyces pijperi]|uniref:CAAX prenyl protease n=1 Tax=Wickerhamomyces pijperi TaxID=599730 RepID=A0A9P8TNV7_WICPI|nr:hypothetical protein WICPIJ_003424 [Wickerhamomyces pijperi]